MKKSSPLFLIIMIGLVLQLACKKDEQVGSPEKDNEVVDSGQYNPSHFLPLKMGAYWEYRHDNGILEKVTCSERLDSIENGAYAHRLDSDFPYNQLPQIEPQLNGVFISRESSIYRPSYILCSRSSPSNLTILDNSLGDLHFWPSYICRHYPTFTHYLVCLDSNTTLDSFQEVAVMLYVEPKAIQSAINPDINSPYKLLKPLVIEGNSAYSISWYAKGVGLIRRDIYDDQVLIDRMRLTNYYFPQ